MKKIITFFTNLFKKDFAETQAEELYWQIVAQARHREIYEKFSIPDTLDGRFDSLLIHLFLVIERLQSASEQKIADHLLRLFTKDMDRSLRETGVGDPSISRKMRKIGEAYMGRMRAYESAINDVAALEKAIFKNIYREDLQVSAETRTSFTHYIMAYKALLSQFSPTMALPQMTATL